MSKPDTTTDTPTDSESAFALRAALKQSQTQVTQERLFERFGQQLFEQGWSEALLQWLLEELCLATGAAHGLIMQQHAGALKILAQRGKTFPIGTRIPMMGVLASWLKEPISFQVHSQAVQQLWSLAAADHTDTPLYFHHTALACQHRAVGLIALATVKPLNASLQSTLHSVCGLLGFVLQQQNTLTNPLRDDGLLQILTPREREVFALLPSGASNAALAEKLGISPGTIKIHVERILNKLNVKDRTQAAVKAVEAGFSSEGL